MEIKRDSARADETIFRRAGAWCERGVTEERREGGEKGQAERSEKASGWDFRGGAAISTYFHGSDFSGPGVTVSAVFTSRGNYIKSFCKGREN